MAYLVDIILQLFNLSLVANRDGNTFRIESKVASQKTEGAIVFFGKLECITQGKFESSMVLYLVAFVLESGKKTFFSCFLDCFLMDCS